MANFNAIQTHYAGHHFRSRLEARWARFFDVAGITWEYEKEGYRLPSGPYLPDFWLPRISDTKAGRDADQGVWFEVKGTEPTKHEDDLAQELAVHTNNIVLIAHGQIPAPPKLPSWWDGHHYGIDMHTPGGWDNYREFVDNETVEYIGEPEPSILQAYKAARAARFEHGETPHP